MGDEGFEAYMCLTDFDWEQGNPIKGNRIFSTLEGLRDEFSCIDGCGYAKVRVSLSEAVKGSDPG